MEIGIRELKAKLSQYISVAARGEKIIITDRGKPVAELSAINAGSNLERGLDEGWIEPARRTRLSSANPVAGVATIMNELDQDRS